MGQQHLQNIYYFCIPENRPTGGIKYLLRHSHLINRMTQYGVSSAIHILNHPEFEPTWQVPFALKRDNRFNRHTDLIVLPEIMVEKTAPTLQMIGARYSILVQNGVYAVQNGPPLDRVAALYDGAISIMSTSEDITTTLRGIFRNLKPPIFNINYAFDSEVFSPGGEKRNLITYMPRKLPVHSHLVRRYLWGRDLRGWTIQPIDGLNEAGVVELLRASRIFMSFSDVEGFGLPPVEAALLGNKVIGYTGIGGREYFVPPLFEPIENSDFLGYAMAVEREIARQSESGTTIADEFAGEIARLAERYSPQNERLRLFAFVEAAIKSFGRD